MKLRKPSLLKIAMVQISKIFRIKFLFYFDEYILSVKGSEFLFVKLWRSPLTA